MPAEEEGSSGGHTPLASRSSQSQDPGSCQATPIVSLSARAAVFMAAALPNLVLVVFFSNIGYGLAVIDAVSPQSSLGRQAFQAAAAMLVLLYVLDWPNWAATWRRRSALLPWGVASAGTVLYAGKWPSSPAFAMACQTVIFQGTLWAGPCRAMGRAPFYRAAFLSNLVCGGAMALVWIAALHQGTHWKQLEEQMAAQSPGVYSIRGLLYERDCASVSSEVPDVVISCRKASTVLFFVWACPFLASCCNFAMAAFAWMQGVVPDLDDVSKLERDLKWFVLLLSCAAMGVYSATSLAGPALYLSSTLMAFALVSISTLMAWVLVEVGPSAVIKRVEGSMIADLLLQGLRSNWVKAMAVGSLYPLYPLYLVEVSRQQLRQFYFGAGALGDPVSAKMQWLKNELRAFDWVDILVKICILGELFFVLQVGVAKATYVMLSWINGLLLPYGLRTCIVVVWIIGYIMFLIPAVPGVPVYVFCGIVLTQQSLSTMGFSGGCIVSILVAFLLKLFACAGQYAIGVWMGKSVKIQQLIGVDKVFTRAIEDILMRPGLDAAKVAVLVGGPDWPVSVTCGILKVDMFQMLLGTTPVLFVAAPVVLTGSFLMVEDRISMMVGQACATAGVITQTVSLFLAVYYITLVVDEKGEELARPRPEHEAVLRLTQEEAQYNEAYRAVTSWRTLAAWRKATIVAAAVFMNVSGCTFALLGSYCFRAFRLTSRIDDPFEQGGLNGNALDIVLPLGWWAMAFFSLACLLHYGFQAGASGLAARHLEGKAEEKEASRVELGPVTSQMHDRVDCDPSQESATVAGV